jgi:hypothetical protein
LKRRDGQFADVLDVTRATFSANAQLSRLRKAGGRIGGQGRGIARHAGGGNAADIGEDIARLEAKAAQALKDLYAELTPWQKTQVARHPQRPHCLDYVGALIQDFVPFAGDRKFGDDAAIVGGFGRFRARASASSATKRAPPPKAGSSTISAWRGRRATARRSG